MVDFQSRDTSRGYGDDEDEEEEEGDQAEGATEPAPESQGTDAGEEDGTTDDERAGDAPATETEEGSEADAAPDQGERAPTDSADDPLAPSDDAATDPSGTDEGHPVDDPDPSPEDGAPAADSGSDDPLAPSTESESTEPESTEERADGPEDHPFADSSGATGSPAEGDAGVDATAGTDTGTDGRPRETEPAGPDHAESHGHSGDHGHGTGGGSHGSDDHAHETGGHDHAHDSGGHAHDHTHGAEVGLLGVAVVTVSSTRTHEDDPSGDVIEALIEAADHEVVTREILRDDLDGVQTALLNLTGRDDVDVVVTTGGTGVTPDDVTVEGARPLFDRELPGFGELFRILSYEEIGTRAMVSRATAGMVDGVPVFCLPGSEDAARLGTEELVVEEMAHLVSLARRDD